VPETFQEKTEQPTEKRIEDARKKGQVAQSKELPACLMILSSAILLYFSMTQGFEQMFKIYANYARNLDVEVTMGNICDLLSFGTFRGLLIVIPVLALLLVIAIFACLLQTGFMWSFETVKFSFENVNPLAGMKKLLSKRSAIEVIKSIVKIGILIYIAYSLIVKELPLLLSLIDRDTGSIVVYVGKTAFSLALKVGFVFLFIAGLDYLVQRWQYRKDLRMTQQEVKEEFKEREGNPLVKSRIRSLQREMSRRRMIEDVKKADVVVTNPTTFAIALTYTVNEMPAPRVVAKGAGFVAEKIKQTARNNGVPLVENKPLARAIFYSVKIGEYVPEKFYLIVAELLAEVYRNRRRIVI
jgi:flagellar biosynthesis protein FlhB